MARHNVLNMSRNYFYCILGDSAFDKKVPLADFLNWKLAIIKQIPYRSINEFYVSRLHNLISLDLVYREVKEHPITILLGLFCRPKDYQTNAFSN